MITLGAITLTACASHAPKGDYVEVEKSGSGEINVEYAGRCAYALSQGKLDMAGKKMFRHETGEGKIYYFADALSKEKFLSHEKENRSLADVNWNEFLRASDR